jgi:hypothetical protein
MVREGRGSLSRLQLYCHVMNSKRSAGNALTQVEGSQWAAADAMPHCITGRIASRQGTVQVPSGGTAWDCVIAQGTGCLTRNSSTQLEVLMIMGICADRCLGSSSDSDELH